VESATDRVSGTGAKEMAVFQKRNVPPIKRVIKLILMN
jgi:hypothetical protein